jgi:hypothetical protein
MSFAIDAPALVGIGTATALVTDDNKARAALSAGTLAAFYGVSLSMYFDAKWVRPFWKFTGAPTGRDWIINSQIFRFDTSKMGLRGHSLAAAAFASYPVWLFLGILLGDFLKRRRARRREAAEIT